VTGAAPATSPATSEVDDEAPLKKADRLPSPYFDDTQAKVTRTLVIIPDPPLEAKRSKPVTEPRTGRAQTKAVDLPN